MRHLALALALLLASVANATRFLRFGQNALPSCAKTCTNINAASGGCLTSNQACFCQSAFLSTLWSAHSQAVCQDSCPSSAEAQIKSWYTHTCAALAPPGAVIPQGAPTSVTPSTAPAITPTAGVSGVVVSASPSSTPTIHVKTNKKSWWSEHGKWIAMVIVLVVVFTIIIIGGIYLKRRHNRKKMEQVAGPGPRPDSWGPRSSQHYATNDAEKGKGRAGKNPTATRGEKGKRPAR